MAATHPAYEPCAYAQREAAAEVIAPGAGGIDNPGGLDGLLAAIELVAEEHATGASIYDFEVQHFSMISCLTAGVQRISQPFRD